MKLNSNYSKNNEVHIHYLDSINDSDSTLVPLLICPGLSEVAEEYEDFIKCMLPRRCVVLSFRGRGKSDTPNFGYDLKDHISDVESVVKDAKLDRHYASDLSTLDPWNTSTPTNRIASTPLVVYVG